MLTWMLLSVALAGPIAGAQYVPFSRADLAWVDDGRTTGNAVGEFDGIVRPALSPFAGAWLNPHWALLGSVGIARLTTTSYVGEVYRQRHWGVIRPSVEVRYAFGSRPVHAPWFWVGAGFHGDIPSARDVSNGYTDEEQAAADDTANGERLQLGGYGGRISAGVNYRLVDGCSLGLGYAIEVHRGVLRSSEASTVSSWVASEPSLQVLFEL